MNSDSTAKALIQINYDGAVKLTLSVKAPKSGEYEKIPYTTHDAFYGYNLFEIPLVTDETGIYDYKLEVEAANDIWSQNNVYTFSQEVKSETSVFL